MEKLPEIMWKTYEDVGGWVKFSDTKAAALLATNGTILAIIFSKCIDNACFLIYHKLLLIFIASVFFFGLGSIYYAIRCLNPRFDLGEPNSLIYFAHIAKKYDNYFQYDYDMKNLFRNDSFLNSQIAFQVWANSKVALGKYVNVSWSIRFFFGLIFSLILAGIELTHIYINLTREFF